MLWCESLSCITTVACILNEKYIPSTKKNHRLFTYLFNIFVCVKVFFNESEIFSGVLFSDGADTKKSDTNIVG